VKIHYQVFPGREETARNSCLDTEALQRGRDDPVASELALRLFFHWLPEEADD
jgi:hypothetical protein